MSSLYVKQSITELLRYSRGNKGCVLPRPIIAQMEKILLSKKSTIYPFEILEIYQHFCINNDQLAFQRIDSLIFPPRGKEVILQPTLVLAYKRLYCLMKYQMPYSTWLKKIRQLMHDEQIYVTDFRHIFTLATFDDLRHNDIFQSVYNEILTIFAQKCQQIDLPSLIALRRYIIKGNVNNLVLERGLKALDDELENRISFLTCKQFKFLYQAKIDNEKWAFYYFFSSHRSIFRKFGFYMIFMLKNSEWKKWAVQKFTINQVFEKMPDSNYKPLQKFITIIDRVYSNSSIYKQFVDQFFQFIDYVEPETGQVKTRLKNPAASLSTYLLNVYYYFDTDNPKLTKQTLKRIRDVLEQAVYLKKQFLQVFMYLNIQLSLAYYGSSNPEQKKNNEILIFREKSSLITYKHTNLQKYSHTNYKLLPTNTMKNLASLEFEVYKTQQFKVFFEKFIQVTDYIQKSIITSKYPKDFLEMQKIMSVYMNQSPSKDNIMFFGEVKKIMTHDIPNIEITIAKQVEINRKITVDFLVKIKNTQTGKQIKYLLDFVSKGLKHTDIMKPQIFWKYNYLVNWCKLDYDAEEWVEFEDYFTYERLNKKIDLTKIENKLI